MVGKDVCGVVYGNKQVSLQRLAGNTSVQTKQEI